MECSASALGPWAIYHHQALGLRRYGGGGGGEAGGEGGGGKGGMEEGDRRGIRKGEIGATVYSKLIV